MRKRLWICAGLLAVSMTCTIHAEVVDMGGFQIQVGQKSDEMAGTQDKTGNDTQKKNGQVSRAENAVKTQQETSREPSCEQYAEPNQERQAAVDRAEAQNPSGQAVQEQQESVWTETGSAVPSDPWMQGDVREEEQIYFDGVWQQEERIQTRETQIQEERIQGQEAVEAEIQQPETKETKETEKNEKGQKTAAEENEGNPKKQKKAKGRQTEQEEKEHSRHEVQFVHAESMRLKSQTVPSVRLKGEQEVCVLSYAVNHQECACRWEGNRLFPVEPPLRKGMNCLEISVFAEDGQVISMEPWYFSCGVGSAML